MHTATHNKEYSPGRQFVSTVTIASTGKGRKRGERLNKKKSLQLKIKQIREVYAELKTYMHQKQHLVYAEEVNRRKRINDF